MKPSMWTPSSLLDKGILNDIYTHNTAVNNTKTTKDMNMTIQVPLETMCHPVAYTFMRFPFFSVTGASDFNGEKWHTQLSTDTHVGNAIPVHNNWTKRWRIRYNIIALEPFFILFSFLYTLPVSSAINLSPNTHKSNTTAPSTALSNTVLNIPAQRIFHNYTLCRIYSLYCWPCLLPFCI